MANFTIHLPPGVPDSEYSRSFLQSMVNAMGKSFFKYGAVADGYPDKVDALKCLRLRLERYEDTGNTEMLVDAANFAMIEFMHPKQKGATYHPVDSSPGRVWNAGTVSEEANTAEVENTRRGAQRGSTAGGFYKQEGD